MATHSPFGTSGVRTSCDPFGGVTRVAPTASSSSSTRVAKNDSKKPNSNSWGSAKAAATAKTAKFPYWFWPISRTCPRPWTRRSWSRYWEWKISGRACPGTCRPRARSPATASKKAWKSYMKWSWEDGGREAKASFNRRPRKRPRIQIHRVGSSNDRTVTSIKEKKTCANFSIKKCCDWNSKLPNFESSF